MAGERLDAALAALDALVVRLDPTDHFGLVTFDDQVEVVVPAGPLGDKAAVRAAIAAVTPGGMTNLSAGYLRGLQEARRVAGPGGATVLLLSDGHVNAGVTGHGELAGLAAGAREHGITTSTIGLGLDDDEARLAAISTGGAGTAGFAEDGDECGRLVAGEVDGLLDRVVQAASLVIRPTNDVATVTLYNDLPVTALDDALMVELGDLFSAEQRKLRVGLTVPAMPALGLAQVCAFELTWTELPSFETHTLTHPVAVNVVPGDDAAGRVPHPTVVSEKAFQEVQRAKREAVERLRRGDVDGFDDVTLRAMRMASAAPASPELADELLLLSELREDASAGGAARVAKFAEADVHRKRRRGR
jgi:Ca-activated chloride channel family protein